MSRSRKSGDMLVETLRHETADLLALVGGELLEAYGFDNVEVGSKFRYAKGDIPVMVVAHVDTVHYFMPEKIFTDKKKTKLWAKDGLGADDRAGVFLIRHLIADGYRPHVLFTDEEETGGAGARQAAGELTPKGVRLCIELDRMNSNDAVFYSCPSKEARSYCKGFGWKEATGSFTDISVVCPAWDIAGVNLSVGYYAQHTSRESLKLGELCDTYRRVSAMLESPPDKNIPYANAEEKEELSKRSSFGRSWSHSWDDNYYGNSVTYQAGATSTTRGRTAAECKVFSYDEESGGWVRRKRSARRFTGDVDVYLAHELNFTHEELQWFTREEKEALAIEHQEEVERGWHK